MKKIFLLFLLFTYVCSTFAQSVITVSGTINSNTTWTKNNQYLLSGFVYVKNGSVLTIEPGTVIKGEKATKGTLIITRGCKIIADGTASEPIVFTSNELPTERGYADWGGLVIAGNARCNIPGGEGLFEGGLLDNPDGDGRYGGLNDNDNSGILRYVRIEYGGITYQPNNEVNGLTLGAVGNGTIIDHIQVSFCGDDAFEFFGGTVNVKHLVSFRNLDDDFDCDFGYRGKMQFGIALRDSAVADAVSGSNGFEIDNDAASSGNMPYTSPIISNFTILGPKVTLTNPFNSNFKRAAHLRKNSRPRIFNTLFLGFPTGIVVDGDSCHASAAANLLKVKNCLVSGMTKNLDSISGSWAITPWFNGNSNTVYANNSSMMLTDPFNYSNFNATPATGSPALGTASFADTDISTGFDVVTYKGALGSTNWLSGWTNFDPQNTDYTVGINENPYNVADVNVYPNPANSVLNISINASNAPYLVYNIYNSLGANVATLKNEDFRNNTLDIHSFAKGVYMLNVVDPKGNSVYSTKFIKE